MFCDCDVGNVFAKLLYKPREGFRAQEGGSSETRLKGRGGG